MYKWGTMKTYTDTEIFTMQLQLWVLTALHHARDLGFIVRRRGLKVDVRNLHKLSYGWEPLSWPVWEHGANGSSHPRSSSHGS